MQYQPLKIKLINEEKSSLDEVVNNIEGQKLTSKWAEKTNDLAANYARHLGEVYGDNWYKGFLSEEDLWKIKLPQHGHLNEKESNLLLFPDDTLLEDAVNYYSNPDPEYTKDCTEHIGYLENKIKENGFNSSIVLVIINNNLKHVDGLHRIVALGKLLKDGYKYTPIPVYLCDNTK